MSSLLASAVSRAGPSVQKNALAALPSLSVSVQTRHASGGGPPPRMPPPKKEHKVKPGQAFWRSMKSNPGKSKEITGTFRPMGLSQLTDELFEPETRKPLDLDLFEPKAIKPANAGTALAFPVHEEGDGPAQIFGLPKQMLLEFRILSTPCSIVRDITLDTARMMDEVKLANKPSQETRVVLTGNPGCGKSFLMLQTVEYCKANDWIVLYIPRAVNLINSTTPYTYDLRTRTYLQPRFSFQILQRLLSVNRRLLEDIPLQEAFATEKGVLVKEGGSVADLVRAGMRDASFASAPAVLEGVGRALEGQTKYPVLLAVDDFQALYCKTAYRDPHFNTIRPYHLSVPRMIMEYASGRRGFTRGAFLGAINTTDPLYQLPLELRDALGTGYAHSMSPYDKRSQTLLQYTTGLRALPVPAQLSVRDAGALFEVWMKDKALVSSSYDEMFLAKYTESGGNARDFVWKGLLSTLAV